MKRIFIPTQGPEDWKRLLAKPDLHWKAGCSAMTTAACWESPGSALPPDVRRVLDDSHEPALGNLELLAAFPEWQTQLPGGDRASCTDVMALARNQHGLVVIAVEAKVDEPFGPTVGEKRVGASPGQIARLQFLESLLIGERNFADTVRYQLMHRTASAILTAQQFHADTAMMLIHSFSAVSRWREDFTAFCGALGAEPLSDSIWKVPRPSGPALFLGWCAGAPAFGS